VQPRDPEVTKSTAFIKAVEIVYREYQAIKPGDGDHELSRRYEEEKDGHLSYWSLLRASCLHYHVCKSQWTGFPTWVWHVAGRELCYLKTLSHSKIVLMTAEMHAPLKVNSKWTKSILERKVVVDDVDDVDAANVDDETPEIE
jgi:hypothetical protein